MITRVNNVEVLRIVNALSPHPVPVEITNVERRIVESPNGEAGIANHLPVSTPLARAEEKDEVAQPEEAKPDDTPGDQFRYRFDKRVEALVVEVVDWKTGEVVRTIPPEEYLKLRRKMDTIAGEAGGMADYNA